MTPWISALATLLGGGLLTALLPYLYLWQNETRRLQVEAEARVKRLEAVEKALSIATKADKFGIKVSETSKRDLQSGLQQIVHEFGDPVTLSWEALETWAELPSVDRAQASVNFTLPAHYRRAAKTQVHMSWVLPLIWVLFEIPSLQSASQTNKEVFLIVLGILVIVSTFGSLWFREKTLQKAFSTLRTIRENQIIRERVISGGIDVS